MYPFGPFPGNYQAFLPPPPIAGQAGHKPGHEGDRFESNQPEQAENAEHAEGKKHSWFASFGKEVLLNGLTVAASIAGGIVGGVAGAVVAGSLTSATLGIVDQKLFRHQKKIDWTSVGIDGALGLIPGTMAEFIAKGGSRMLAKSTGKVFDIGARNSVKHGAIVGATDGLILGSVGGVAHSAYDSYKKDGKVNWGQASKDGANALLTGAIGGGLGAGALMAMRGGKINPFAVFRKSGSSGGSA